MYTINMLIAELAMLGRKGRVMLTQDTLGLVQAFRGAKRAWSKVAAAQSRLYFRPQIW